MIDLNSILFEVEQVREKGASLMLDDLVVTPLAVIYDRSPFEHTFLGLFFHPRMTSIASHVIPPLYLW